MEPGYKYNEKLVVFERINTGKTNEDYQLIQPNQDELNNANQYNNYIPNYQIINVGEQIALMLGKIIINYFIFLYNIVFIFLEHMKKY